MRPHGNRTSPERRPSPSRRPRYMNNGSPPYHPHHFQQQQHNHKQHHRHHQHQQQQEHQQHQQQEEPTPICRCRVLYLGSAVPHVTKDGLQGIQEPLKELYPEEGAQGAKGIDSWLSVWSNGFLLENVDENRKKVTRFFPVESLHYCAAVRYVLVPGSSPPGGHQEDTSSSSKVARFLPLDSPFARNPNINHPPLFAAILRRTTGIKVLECHVFICKRETAANALVRCSFHSYADSTYAKHIESGGGGGGGGAQSIYGTLAGGTLGAPTPLATPSPGAAAMMMNGGPGAGGAGPGGGSEIAREYQQSVIEVSEDSINSIEKVEEWKVLANGNSSSSPGNNNNNNNNNINNNNNNSSRQQSPKQNGNGTNGNPDEISVFNGDDNHKVWAGKTPPPPGQGAPDSPDNIYDYGSTLRSFRSNASGLSRNRPRQMVMPSSPPPPPIPEELTTSVNGKDEKKEKKKKKRSKSRENTLGRREQIPNGDVPHRGGGGGSVLVNGGGGGGRPGSAMAPAANSNRKFSSTGSLMGVPTGRHQNGYGPPLPPPPPPPPMMMTLRPAHLGKKAGTFSARGKGLRPLPPFMMYPPHMMPPPHLMPPPGHPLYGMPPPPPPQLQQGPPPRGAVEEPIYMPHNARPLSPIASYQPGHFPHEAYYNQQQYATIDKANKYRKHHKKGSSSNKHHFGGGSPSGGAASSAAPPATQQPAPIHSSDSNAGEDSSDFTAGIYKKGHINERAFSYSIRNEHRSRSYGSLANMQFGPNGEPVNGGGGGGGSPMNGHHEGGGGGDKKDRELFQMVSDLELGDEVIERREVPPGLYPPGRGGYGPPPPPPNNNHHSEPNVVVGGSGGGGGGGQRKRR